MRLLVYGFGPYKQFKSNITQQILRNLPRSSDLQKVVFPVRFNKSQFTAAIAQHRPDVILGLGQCSSGTKLRVERRAVNVMRNHKEERGRAIVRGAAKALRTTLRLRGLGKQANASRNAGDYVCNFSMYVMLDYLKRRRKSRLYGFIHIPHDYHRRRASRFVKKIIERLREGS